MRRASWCVPKDWVYARGTDCARQKGNFLFGIGADICRRHKEDGAPGHIVNEVQDKVVQDADDSEGT